MTITHVDEKWLMRIIFLAIFFSIFGPNFANSFLKKIASKKRLLLGSPIVTLLEECFPPREEYEVAS